MSQKNNSNVQMGGLIVALYLMLIMFFGILTAYIAPSTGLVDQMLVAVPASIAVVYAIFSMLSTGATQKSFLAPSCYVVVLEKGTTLQETLQALRGMGMQPVMVSA